MSVIIGPYAHDFFQSLPTLEEAKANFTKANGQDLVSNRLKDLFVEADMDRRFGLTLLHRHFDLASNEKLVEYGGTCSPWEKGAVELGPLQPAIWAFDNNGNLKPTEFRYSSEQDAPLSVKELAFAARLKSELETRGLVKLFGLSRYPGDGFQGSCEFTQDRVNINLNPKDYPRGLVAIDTHWFFSEPLWTRGCRCTCNASAKDHPHGVHVYTRSDD